MSIYLDNAATTALAPEVLEAMLPYLTEVYGNPSSKHAFGDAAKSAVIRARGQVAGLLEAKPPEIVFTGSATEANHMAVHAALALMPERRRIVTTAVEHPSQLLLFNDLEARGYLVERIPVAADGTLDLEALARAIDGQTALVSVMWANNETGVVLPVSRACALAQRAGALFHTDAVQAAGRLPVSVRQVPADFLTLSAHKLHGPKGIGALYVRKGIRCAPLLFGHQERRRRGGTENVPAIAGFGTACSLAEAHLADVSGRVRALRDRLEEAVMAALPCVRINGHPVVRVPAISNLMFAHLDGEAILHRLDQAGIAVSPGAACSASGSAPSHVLTAMGLSEKEAGASLRISLSRYTDEAEIERVIAVLPPLVREIAGRMPASTNREVTV